MLFDPALPPVVEEETVPLDAHVRLAQRRQAERLVLLEVPLAPDAKEAFADHVQHRRAYLGARHVAAVEIPPQTLADARQLGGEPAHAVVLALLPSLDGTGMIAVLLAPPGVDPPRLHRGARARRDVHVRPPRRHPQRVDARQLAGVSHELAPGIRVTEAASLRSESSDPALCHRPTVEARSTPGDARGGSGDAAPRQAGRGIAAGAACNAEVGMSTSLRIAPRR